MAPCVNRRPLIRLTCSTRSAIKVLRSRPSRRRSSSSTLGGLAIAQTLGSPRLKAISVPHGDEGGHEQGVAQFGSSAADETLAAPLTALAGHGRQAREARG